MVSSVVPSMKSLTKPKSKKRPVTSRKIVAVAGSDGVKRYLALILATSLLNLLICAVLLAGALTGSGWMWGGGFEMLARVPADPSTGLILPQKPIKVDVYPSVGGGEADDGDEAEGEVSDDIKAKDGAGARGEGEGNRGWLPKEGDADVAKKKTSE